MANLFTVIINIAFIPLFVSVLKLSFTILAPIIFVLCIVGGYAPTQDLHDVWLIVNALCADSGSSTGTPVGSPLYSTSGLEKCWTRGQPSGQL